MINQDSIYADRWDAGQEVARLLKKKYKDQDALVLGIPRGGVIVAYEVAKTLHAELSVVITKRIPHPDHPELTIGSIAEDGSVYFASPADEFDKDEIKKIVSVQEEEILRRIERFRKGKPLPDMKNRIVILVDDGIATNSTIIPAIDFCRKQKASKIIVASPVSGERHVPEISALADEVVIAAQPEMFYAVGQVYEIFRHLSDDEIVKLLEDFEVESGRSLVEH